MYTKTFHCKRATRGFTLLETLTSIAILAMVIIGPLAVIINSSSYARETKDTVIATYLAEEAIELLQNQYDSLYVFCKKQPSDPLCTTATSETPGQIAWRLFKQRLGDGGDATHPSCFLKRENGDPDNASGCSYDFVYMIGDITTSPSRYITTEPECKYIVGVATTTTTGIRHMYVCQGVSSHYMNGEIDSKNFTRSVSVEWLPSSFEVGATMAEYYQDDLRITVEVEYRGVNGYPRTITVVRFMHSQP
jgi:prepilin-type N-terminal cleavage/methylation domain-containing protein